VDDSELGVSVVLTRNRIEINHIELETHLDTACIRYQTMLWQLRG